MRKKIYISIISLFLFSINLHCQETKEVQLALKSYARWLDRINISQSILSVDTMEMTADKVILYLNSDCDRITWNKLDSLCNMQVHMSLSNFLIKRLNLDVDNRTLKGKIVIDGKEGLTIITQSKDTAMTEFLVKQGVVPAYRKFALNEIHFISSKNHKIYNKYITIEKIRRELVNKLPFYLKTCNGFCDYIPKNDDDLPFLPVEFKLKGEIIPNHKYWEYIVIIFHFSQSENKLIIEYDVDGTYASGRGFGKPAKSEFSNNRISDTFIFQFCDKMNQILDNIIKNR